MAQEDHDEGHREEAAEDVDVDLCHSGGALSTVDLRRGGAIRELELV